MYLAPAPLDAVLADCPDEPASALGRPADDRSPALPLPVDDVSRPPAPALVPAEPPAPAAPELPLPPGAVEDAPTPDGEDGDIRAFASTYDVPVVAIVVTDGD